MGIYSVIKTLMQPLDYVENKRLCRDLLDHDPKMISSIYNYDFELVKPYLARSITIIDKISFVGCINFPELAKILNFTYEKDKRFRKSFLETIIYYLSKKDNYSSANVYRSFDINLVSDNLYNIFLYDPLYFLIYEEKFFKKIFKAIGKDYIEYLKKIDYDKVILNIKRKLEKKELYRDRTILDVLASSLVGWYSYRSDNMSSDIDKKIESLQNLNEEANNEIPGLLTLALYLKLET